MVVGDVTDCREWQGTRLTPTGYGRIWRAGVPWLVHRWVWTMANGPIPDGMHVCHTCDNRPCFRLAHLFLGTRAENMADMVAKGRSTKGRNQGVDNASAKLTADEVRAIRAALASGEKGTTMAATYGISDALVSCIRHRQLWDWLDR